jgi:hypothetical protein
MGAAIGGAPYGGDSLAGQTGDDQDRKRRLMEHCTLFVLSSQYVLFGVSVLAPFHINIKALVPFDFSNGPLCLPSG